MKPIRVKHSSLTAQEFSDRINTGDSPADIQADTPADLSVRALPSRWYGLPQFYLSPAARQVYLSLRQQPDVLLDPTRWALSLGLTENQLAAALQELEKHGFVCLSDD